MQQRTVSFIGLGGVASGSDFLYTYITAHSEVCVLQRPTNFFIDVHRYQRGLDWYEMHWQHCKAGKQHGECAMLYLAHAEAAERIARSYPQAKLLAVVCNPIDRVYYEYRRAQEQGTVTKQVTLARYIELHPEALTRGLFGQHLQTYFDLYSPLQLYVAVHEDRYDDPIAYVQNVYRFLELTHVDFVPRPLRRFVQVDEDEHHPHRPWWWRLGYRLVAPIRWLRLDVVTRLLWRRLIRPYWPAKWRLHWQTHKQVATIPRPEAVPIDPELRQLLVEYYAGDVYRLSLLLHRDLNAEWDIPRTQSTADKAH